ncbi:MAG: antitoxin [Chloroflexia bacterium]
MNRAVDFSEETYTQLQETARRLGFDNIEQLVKQWLWEVELRRRQELGRKIDKHREEMLARYGVMSDSTELIRQDRER